MRVLRLKTGEELITTLQDFARRSNVRGAWFWAIGATDDLVLAFYDLTKKQYLTKRFRQRLEILNITGNLAKTDILTFSRMSECRLRGFGKNKRRIDLQGEETAVHAHGVFGKPDFSVIGGHVVSCRVSATCEVYLEKLSALRRAPDSKTGLNLLM
jgi:predicted DNA-binding protein with PD1-like motif